MSRHGRGLKEVKKNGSVTESYTYDVPPPDKNEPTFFRRMDPPQILQ